MPRRDFPQLRNGLAAGFDCVRTAGAENTAARRIGGAWNFSPQHLPVAFGADIRGPWMTPNNFFKVLALHGLGWKDIHATTVIKPDPAFQSTLRLRGYRTALPAS